MKIAELVKKELDKLQTDIDNLRNELGKYNEQPVEQPIEQKYPIYCKRVNNPMVVKFTELTEGAVVVNSIHSKIGYHSKDWTEHTNTNVWQHLEVCPETGFFDGQAVWCWDNYDTHVRLLRFYDVRNTCTYKYNGRIDGAIFDNYEPFEGNYTEWMLKAFETLKR
jgi:hypothetical protein